MYEVQGFLNILILTQLFCTAYGQSANDTRYAIAATGNKDGKGKINRFKAGITP